MIKKIIKFLGLSFIGLLVILTLTGIVFMNFSKQFGGKHSKLDIKRYEASGHFKEGKFQNLIKTGMDMSIGSIFSTMKDFIRGIENGKPKQDIPMQKPELTEIKTNKSQLIWFGHSAFLLQLSGKNLLIDPMLGKVPAPHPWVGGNRFQKELPVNIKDLPVVDAILISHDHYDHLDYESILALKDKTKHFFVPLGVGAHFRAWGIDSSAITEMNWWEEIEFEQLKLAFAPSRHFSGRGFSDRNSTLWGSWVIQSDSLNVYFSGDGGYGPHFKDIGKKYGPFDFAMMECGQYNEKWHDIHMMPEETAQATTDVNTKLMMPIHWGSFQLALHSWTDPVERVSAALKKNKQNFIIPEVGEIVDLNQPNVLNSYWWK